MPIHIGLSFYICVDKDRLKEENHRDNEKENRKKKFFFFSSMIRASQIILWIYFLSITKSF